MIGKFMRILILTSAHQYFDSRIFFKEAITLKNAGHDVSIVSQASSDIQIDGIRIIAIPFTETRVERFFLTVIRISRIAFVQKADVYHFHDSDLIPLGILLSLIGRKVIYDVHEDLPKQILAKKWIPKLIRGIISNAASSLELIASKVFAGIIAATPAIAKKFNGNTVVVCNYPIILTLNPKIEYAKRNGNIVYVGAYLSDYRGAFEMVRAMGLLKTQINLEIAGNITPTELVNNLSKLSSWKSVILRGFLTKSDVEILFSNARVGLIVEHPLPNHLEALPIKMFEYMANGIPIITSNFPLWKEIVEKTGCGIAVDPLNDSEIANAIDEILMDTDLATQMSLNGIKAAKEIYNWDSQAVKLVEFYEKLQP
jgi:glycosyltransferase involved in cell wall biosynthesis